MRSGRGHRLGRCVALLALAIPTASCGEEIVVRVSTRVWPQGGVGRRVEIEGRERDGAKPREQDWLEARARVQLASPQLWSRIDESPGRLVAEGVFPRAEDLPPALAHHTQTGIVADHSQAALLARDLAVMKRWVYRETLGDPYGAGEAAIALDALLAMMKEALREEVRRTFGRRVDPAPAERFLENEFRSVLRDLLPGLRQAKIAEGVRDPAFRTRWTEALVRHGVPVADDAEEPFSTSQVDLLLSWCRERVARALSTPEAPCTGEDLTFWPSGDDANEKLEAIADHSFGGEEGLTRRLEPILAAFSGTYGDALGSRFRFETRLTMPGRLLRTNGTPDRDGVLWLFRDTDLVQGELVLEAESVELDDDNLRSLGARREFDPLRLLELTDLLATRDTDGALQALLTEAIGRQRLAVLREGKVPEEIAPLARELADLLDPDVVLPPADF